MDQQKTTSTQAADKKSYSHYPDDVKAFFDNLTDAIRQGDLEKIMSFYSSDIRAFDMMPPIQFRGTETYKNVAWKECFTDYFKFPVEYEIVQQEVTVKDDTVLSHGLTHMTGESHKGEKIEAWIRNTMILQKIDGRWLIVHEHNSAPSDENGKVLMNLEPDDAAEGFGVH